MIQDPPYTRTDWAAERDWILNDLLPYRRDVFMGQLRSTGVYPTIDAPLYRINGDDQHGGRIEAGDALSIEGTGTIYFTLDGSDPREPVQVEPDLLIAQGSAWQYLDDDSDPGGVWLQSDVDWPSGNGELGYGDGDETTTVNCGPTAPSCHANNFITTHFRRAFTLTDASQYAGLHLRLLRDDGAVLYLNGRELLRNNLPATGSIFPHTLATADAGESESVWLDYYIDAEGYLVDGENILGVGVHQWSSASDDLSFDLEMYGTKIAPAVLSPGAEEYTGAIVLTDTRQIKARAWDGDAWSALTDAMFIVDAPKLVINEFMADNGATIEGPRRVERVSRLDRNLQCRAGGDRHGWAVPHRRSR